VEDERLQQPIKRVVNGVGKLCFLTLDLPTPSREFLPVFVPLLTVSPGLSCMFGLRHSWHPMSPHAPRGQVGLLSWSPGPHTDTLDLTWELRAGNKILHLPTSSQVRHHGLLTFHVYLFPYLFYFFGLACFFPPSFSKCLNLCTPPNYFQRPF